MNRPGDGLYEFSSLCLLTRKLNCLSVINNEACVSYTTTKEMLYRSASKLTWTPGHKFFSC